MLYWIYPYSARVTNCLKEDTPMDQILPRYYFSGEYASFYPALQALPHKDVRYPAGELLWHPGEPITKIFYFHSGLAQCCVEHEDGYRKSLSFHGTGTIFPGVQKTNFKIEKSITLKALTDITATVFERNDFYQFCLDTPQLMAQLYEVQTAYINMLIYDDAHQRYNQTFLKVCNFLFLMAYSDAGSARSITISQENIADTLGVGRNHVTKSLSRLRQENIIQLSRRYIEITDLEKLAVYCSTETLDSSFL